MSGLVEEAVEQATGEGEEAPAPDLAEGQETGAAPAGEASPPPPASPAGPLPITRDDFLEMQKESFARLEKIREEFAGGAKKASDSDDATDPADEAFHAKYLRTPAGWASYCKELAADPSLYERSILAVLGRAKQKDFAAMRKLEKDFAAYRDSTDKELAETRGYRRISEHRFAESPRWQKHGKVVLDLLRDGVFNAGHEKAIDKAFEYAEKMAEKRGATPAQAEAAGNAAAKAVAAKVTKPGPRDEPSLRTGDKRASGSSVQNAPSRSAASDPRWLRSIAADAVEKAMRGK